MQSIKLEELDCTLIEIGDDYTGVYGTTTKLTYNNGRMPLIKVSGEALYGIQDFKGNKKYQMTLKLSEASECMFNKIKDRLEALFVKQVSLVKKNNITLKISTNKNNEFLTMIFDPDNKVLKSLPQSIDKGDSVSCAFSLDSMFESRTDCLFAQMYVLQVKRLKTKEACVRLPSASLF